MQSLHNQPGGGANPYLTESKLIFSEIKEAYSVIQTANYKLLTRRQIQDVHEMALKNDDFTEEQCTTRGIATTGVSFDDLKALEEMNPYREVTHLKKPGGRKGVLYDEWIKLSEDCKGMADKLGEEFGDALPLDIEKKWANAVHAVRMFMRPWLDDKWRRDHGGWAEIFIQRKTTTKHGAQSLSELEGAQIRGYDENGKPIKCYRGITCEQIDNKADEAAEAFTFMYKHIPFFYHMVACFKMAKAPYLVDFTKDLSPKLSHSS